MKCRCLLLLVPIAIGIQAQPVVAVERKFLEKAYLDPKPFETWMANAASFAAVMPWDPRAQSLLAMAEEATGLLFRLDSRQLRRKATKAKVEKLGDMMMLHWDVTVDSASGTPVKGELLLHDTADLSSYALRLRGSLTADQMAEILPRIVPYRFVMITNGDGVSHFTTPSVPRQYDLPNSSQAIQTTAGEWIVVLHRSKGFLRDAYPLDAGKERFPPFGERIRAWSLEKMANEFHFSPGKAWDPTGWVLLREMAKRNPSNEFWKELFFRGAPLSGDWIAEHLWERLQSILSALRVQDPTSERAESFRLFMREPILALGEKANHMMMRALNERQCTAGNERESISQLDDSTLRGSAIEHLGRCSMHHEGYERIQAMSLPAELEWVRLDALHRIRRRQPQRR